MQPIGVRAERMAVFLAIPKFHQADYPGVVVSPILILELVAQIDQLSRDALFIDSLGKTLLGKQPKASNRGLVGGTSFKRCHGSPLSEEGGLMPNPFFAT